VVFADVNSRQYPNCQLNDTDDSVMWSYTDENFKYHQIYDGRMMDARFDSTGRFSVFVRHDLEGNRTVTFKIIS